MKLKSRQSAFSTTEMVVVVATVAVLAVLGIPAIKAVIDSFETEGSTKNMISAALSSARAIAAQQQRYAGIRFQKDCRPKYKNLVDAPQYMIFIVHDPNIGAHSFRAAEGIKPIKLPDNIAVTDLTIVTVRSSGYPLTSSTQILFDTDTTITENEKNTRLLNDNDPWLTDFSCFSIIFAPNGRLAFRGVQVKNMNDTATSKDDVFNIIEQINLGIGMFRQDTYYSGASNFGLGPEPSRNRFLVYDTNKFKKARQNGTPWTGYLAGLVPQNITYINPYTGTIINR